MIPLSERSLDQLLTLVETLHLLTHHRTLDRFVSLSTETRTYVFDTRLARTFLLWLIGGEIKKKGCSIHDKFFFLSSRATRAAGD